MSTPTDTQRKLARMMCEDTGTHFLDSGGTGGRGWQRTRAAFDLKSTADVYKRTDEIVTALASRPDGTVNVSRGYGANKCPEGEARFEYANVDTFQWLVDRVNYDGEVDDSYREWCEASDVTAWEHASMQDWLTSLAGVGREIGYGIYGEGTADNMWINTYNGECSLDETLQFALFGIDGTEYIALQIHRGADVRGGYTDPVIFQVDGKRIYDFDQLSVVVQGDTDPTIAEGQGTLDGVPAPPQYGPMVSYMVVGSMLEDTYSDDIDDPPALEDLPLVDDDGNGYDLASVRVLPCPAFPHGGTMTAHAY